MVKVAYLYINDEINDEMINAIHEQTIKNEGVFVTKENDDFKNQPMFENAKAKVFEDGITILYSDSYMCTMDPLGLLTHILIIKEA